MIGLDSALHCTECAAMCQNRFVFLAFSQHISTKAQRNVHGGKKCSIPSSLKPCLCVVLMRMCLVVIPTVLYLYVCVSFLPDGEVGKSRQSSDYT